MTKFVANNIEDAIFLKPESLKCFISLTVVNIHVLKYLVPKPFISNNKKMLRFISYEMSFEN